MNNSLPTVQVRSRKKFASSILLWVRADQPRETGMGYWKGPHSKIISATKGFQEYRQIHLDAGSPGLWPATRGIETEIPVERRIDGVAEVTFQSALSPLRGRKQTRLAFKDEVNVFRRTLLYFGPPYSSRWYDVAEPGEQVSARALVYLRRRNGVRAVDFRKHVVELSGALMRHGCAQGTPNPEFPAVDRETLGHSERRARQPGRPAVPRVADSGLRGSGRARGLLCKR